MAFKDHSWLNAHAVTLVTVTLADPDGVRDTAYTSDPGASPVLRFCDESYPYTYDSNLYYPGVMSWDGRMAASAFSGRKSDADGTLVLNNGRYVWQQKGSAAPAETAEYNVRLSATMRSFLWAGALVVVTVIAEMPGGTQAAQQVFTGRIHDIQLFEDTIQLQCVEDKEYNRRKPDADGPPNGTSETRWIVNLDDYPDAPSDQIGKSMPLIYTQQAAALELGECLAVNPKNLRGLWPAIVSSNKYNVANDRPAIIEMFHTSPCDIAQPTTRPFIYVPQIDTVAPLYNTGTGGVYDDYHNEWWFVSETYAVMYINPDRFATKSAGGVTDIEKAFDGDATTYAALANTGAGNVNIQLGLPEGMTSGRVVDLIPFVYLAAGTGVGGTDADVNGEFGMWNISSAGYTGGFSQNLTKANLRDGGFINGNNWGTGAGTGVDSTTVTVQEYRWNEISGGSERQMHFRCNITSNGATANIIACGIKIHFQPRGFQASGIPRRDGYGRSYK